MYEVVKVQMAVCFSHGAYDPQNENNLIDTVGALPCTDTEREIAGRVDLEQKLYLRKEEFGDSRSNARWDKRLGGE